MTLTVDGEVLSGPTGGLGGSIDTNGVVYVGGLQSSEIQTKLQNKVVNIVGDLFGLDVYCRFLFNVHFSGYFVYTLELCIIMYGTCKFCDR